MTKFTVESGINVCLGGLIGRILLAKYGYSHPMWITTDTGIEFSCIYNGREYSLKCRNRKRANRKILNQIAREVLNLKHFTVLPSPYSSSIYYIKEKEK